MSNHQTKKGFSHEKIETSNFLMIVLILVTVAFGGLVEIVPLFFQKSTTEPITGLQPYTAVQLAGRDIYTREGDTSVPRRNLALRSLLRGRRIGLRPPIPMG
ncbi:MAG: hypothetical protein RLZZ434_790 [Pseudomonadota bacterium]